MNIFKFGGTSIGSPDAIRRAVGIASKRARAEDASRNPLVVVVSAMAGMTDLLLGAVNAAARGDAEAVSLAARKFADTHEGAIAELVPEGPSRAELRAYLQASVTELENICRSVAVLKELSPRTLDVTVARGERALARIFTTVLSAELGGREVVYVDATELIVVEHSFGTVHADYAACEESAKKHIVPLLERGAVVVVPGYIGRTRDTDLVTLGRGGSDFSAAILANALSASDVGEGHAAVTLYKEVDGLMTTDPRLVPAARLVAELHYREAAELAYYGAKILHPRTMIPLIAKRIPLTIKNTFNPDTSGTRIAGDVFTSGSPVKALTAAMNQALVAVEGRGMMGVPGVAGRTFSALAQAGISVSVISQGSSESSICFIVPEAEEAAAVRAVTETFAHEIRLGLIDGLRVERGAAVIAVVGLGMRGVPGIAARTFGALGRAGTNIVAIAQGSSELNISVVIRGADVKAALAALHDEFQLEKASALSIRSARETSIALFGFGQIGRKLTEQLLSQDKFLKEERGVDWKCVALADRSGVVASNEGFPHERIRAILEAKAKGAALDASSDAASGSVENTLESLRRQLWQMPFSRGIFVDASAEQTAPILLEALRSGFHVALANKKPLTIPQSAFDEMFAEARRRGLSIKYEATVGAGLPVLDTLSKLEEAGDTVLSILGCLSGTLGVVMNALQKGETLSSAVVRAHAAGYTEPDPRDDLSGVDVARKALILARTLGRRLNLEDVEIEPLLPFPSERGPVSEFLASLTNHDATFGDRVAEAKKNGMVLRYVARIGEKQVRVGVEPVPLQSSLGSLAGSDNQVVIRTHRYDQNPLVVTGPGAGADVTAAGVFNDILAIALGREHRSAAQR